MKKHHTQYRGKGQWKSVAAFMNEVNRWRNGLKIVGGRITDTENRDSITIHVTPQDQGPDQILPSVTLKAVTYSDDKLYASITHGYWAHRYEDPRECTSEHGQVFDPDDPWDNTIKVELDKTLTTQFIYFERAPDGEIQAGSSANYPKSSASYIRWCIGKVVLGAIPAGKTNPSIKSATRNSFGDIRTW
jgi:hypothetical protein